MGKCKEDRARLSLAVLSNRARGNTLKWKRVKLCLNTGQHFFTAGAVEHWLRLSQRLWNLHARRCLRPACTCSTQLARGRSRQPPEAPSSLGCSVLL